MEVLGGVVRKGGKGGVASSGVRHPKELHPKLQEREKGRRDRESGWTDAWAGLD